MFIVSGLCFKRRTSTSQCFPVSLIQPTNFHAFSLTHSVSETLKLCKYISKGMNSNGNGISNFDTFLICQIYKFKNLIFKNRRKQNQIIVNCISFIFGIFLEKTRISHWDSEHFQRKKQLRSINKQTTEKLL
jgi:hypothetical protein